MASTHVLVIDDEKGIRDALRQVLEYEDIEVQTAPSGSEALKLYPEFADALTLRGIAAELVSGFLTHAAPSGSKEPMTKLVSVLG